MVMCVVRCEHQTIDQTMQPPIQPQNLLRSFHASRKVLENSQIEFSSNWFIFKIETTNYNYTLIAVICSWLTHDTTTATTRKNEIKLKCQTCFKCTANSYIPILFNNHLLHFFFSFARVVRVIYHLQSSIAHASAQATAFRRTASYHEKKWINNKTNEILIDTRSQ